ncbi:hypothetical protein SMA75_20305 [Escherichia coli]|uniref:hypothetical protein n=1 Tax=Escherichia coli TaxID=562 RepID=UPI003079A2BA
MSIKTLASLPSFTSGPGLFVRQKLAYAIDHVNLLSGAQKTAAAAELQTLLTQAVALLNGAADLTKTAIVVDGTTVPLYTSAGVVSSGSATRNSPATYTVVAGAVTKVTASA